MLDVRKLTFSFFWIFLNVLGMKSIIITLKTRKIVIFNIVITIGIQHDMYQIFNKKVFHLLFKFLLQFMQADKMFKILQVLSMNGPCYRLLPKE